MEEVDEGVTYIGQERIRCKNTRNVLQSGVAVNPTIWVGDVGHGPTPPEVIGEIPKSVCTETDRK